MRRCSPLLSRAAKANAGGLRDVLHPPRVTLKTFTVTDRLSNIEGIATVGYPQRNKNKTFCKCAAMSVADCACSLPEEEEEKQKKKEEPPQTWPKTDYELVSMHPSGCAPFRDQQWREATAAASREGAEQQ